MPNGGGGGHIVKGESEITMRLKRCWRVKRNIEENTLLQYDLKAEAKIEILNKKNSLKKVYIRKDGLVHLREGSRLGDK
jgi:hypothetical protein